MALSLDSSNTRRRGRRGRGRRALSEINVTPLVDVMLVLLIIFMVSAPLLTVGIEVDMPKTEAGAMKEQSEPLVITIRADGAIYIQQSEIAFDQLAPALTVMAGAGLDRPVYVRGDAKSAFERVAQVMAALQKAGFSKIGMITDTGGPTSGARAAGLRDTGETP